MPNELTSAMVKEYGRGAGACAVGIAAAEAFGLAPEGFRPSDVLEGCRSVVVLGAAHPREALGDSVEYTAVRNAMLTKMTDVANEVAKRIKTDGYKAKAVSASGGKTVDGNLYGHISLKHAAALAGLGVLGRNCLLISPQYGTMLWLSAVLTDAELPPDPKARFEICDGCNKCVEACPMGALDDPASFGRKECRKVFAMVNKKLEIKCFLCRTVCPYRFGEEEAG